MRKNKITVAFFVILFIASLIIVFARNKNFENEQNKLQNEANIIFEQDKSIIENKTDDKEKIEINSIVREN